jgi:hypothetical protein
MPSEYLKEPNIYRKKKTTIWKHGGRGKMGIVHVPLGIKELTYQVARILDHESDLDIRIRKIKEILQQI